MKKNKRREFIKKASIGGIAFMGLGKHKGYASSLVLKNRSKQFNQIFGVNDQINLAMIGCGIMGFNNAQTAQKINGVKIVAACDLYSGRLIRMKELFGDHLFTTTDYRQIIDREDIDAVCISTSDHWHDHITIAALNAGKAVYCEKPMMHRPEEGHAMIKAEKKSGKPLIIGSQRVSSIGTEKAKELFNQGVIGELNLADIRYDRASSNGAWQYSIPTDAYDNTVDWNGFIGDAQKREYDPKRFFRWRNYQEYGTGVAGDLFVHLFSALHVITGSIGPDRIYSTGGLRFWKDGRDVPDISLGLYDYPEQLSHPAFNVQMRVNFVDGSGGGSHVRLIGSEGVMTISGGGIHIKKSKVSTVPTYGGWDSFSTFSEAQQNEFKKWFKAHYGYNRGEMQSPDEINYSYPSGYSAHYDHWWNFCDSIRNGTPIIEDGSFGLRAAGPALASNKSYFEKKIINWDAKTMKIV